MLQGILTGLPIAFLVIVIAYAIVVANWGGPK
jgi:hypothetical protein